MSRRPADRRRVFAAILLTIAACGRSDPPRLRVSPVPADGSAGAGAVAVRYRLENAGGGDLLLDGVVPPCACRTRAALPERLSPGASAVLAIECAGAPSRDDAVRTVRVRSSDPAAWETTVPVTLPGARAAAEPSSLYFGYVAVGESATRDVVLGTAVAIAGLTQPSDPSLTIEPLPARADGRPGVRVRFAPRNPGIVRAALDLGPAAGRLPVAGVGHRGVLAFPAELADVGASGGSSVVTVMNVADEPLAAMHVDYPSGVTGEVRTVAPGRQLRLTVRARSGIAPDGGTLRLRAETGAEPVATIPIVGPRDAPAS